MPQHVHAVSDAFLLNNPSPETGHLTPPSILLSTLQEQSIRISVVKQWNAIHITILYVESKMHIADVLLIYFTKCKNHKSNAGLSKRAGAGLSSLLPELGLERRGLLNKVARMSWILGMA